MGWMTKKRGDDNDAAPTAALSAHIAGDTGTGTGTGTGAGPPRDVGNAAYLIFFGLGAGILVPWNAYITAVDYFQFLYPRVHVDRVFSVAYLFPCLIVLCLLTYYGQKFSSWARINVGLCVYLICILVTPTMDAIFIDVNGGGSQATYAVTVGMLVMTGVADAIVQGSVIGMAGELPMRYMQATISGTAACGVAVSCLRILTKASLPATPAGLRLSGNVYFGVSAAYLALLIVAYNLLERLPVIAYYQRQKNKKLRLIPGSSGGVDGDGGEEGAGGGRGRGRGREEDGDVDVGSEQEEEGNSLLSEDGSLKVSLSYPLVPCYPREPLDKASFKHVLGQVKWLTAAMVLTYVVTLSIFPGYLAEDVHSAVLGDWYPVLLMGSYNLFDLVGKQSTSVYIPDSQPLMIGASVARLLFYPLFYICLYGPRLLRTEAPVFFLTCLLGATNGYITSFLFATGPKSVPLREAETAGVFIAIALVVGLAAGSIVSWFWVI